LTILSVPQIISENTASASVAAANFLPNYFIAGTDTNTEMTLSLATAQYITSVLTTYNYPNGCFHRYEDNCTVTGYCNVLQALTSYFDESIVFSKGHRGMPYYPNTNHTSLLDHNGDALIDHSHIYSRTSSENVFTFIWHCETAEKYQYGVIPYDVIGYYSMPYCWTHNLYLGYYGNSGNQVFLGWNNNVPDPPYPEQRGGSPQYEYPINYYDDYSDVAELFWYYMCDGDTVIQALDNLCDDIFDDDFDDTYLKDWLVVWGNKYLELP
jgi:hypothetical protein